MTIKPNHEILSGKIAYYYFYEVADPTFERKFNYFPNYRMALTVFQNSNISWDDKSRSTTPRQMKQFTSILTYTRTKERVVSMNGPINKIGIVFEPLGINYFVLSPIVPLLSETISVFTEFGTVFETLAKQVFSTTDISLKRDLLDHFFIQIHADFDSSKIKLAVETVMKKKGSIKVAELSEQVLMTRKSLLRLFKKHLSISPKSFIDLVRFRNSIDYFKQFKGDLNLTQLADQSNYYDQSSFIKHFYSATGINPRKFFYQSRDLDNPETTWNMITEE